MAEIRSSERRVAVCPVSFDPLTVGHVDLVRRAAAIFDRVIVAILVNDEKTPLLTKDERVALAREVFAHIPAVEVDTFDGLLVDYVAERGAIAIVRGVRSAADLEYEWPMRLMNHHLRPSIDTVFLPTAAALGGHPNPAREGAGTRMLAERMSRVSASPTLKVLVGADKLRQQGVDVVE